MSVYLLHFSPAYKHAKHYLGYADEVAPRVHAHLHGRGARLTQVAKEAGSTLILVRVWEDATRTDERTLKRRSHVPTLCPICQGQGVQLPLLLGELAYVPVVDETELAPALAAPAEDKQLNFDDFNVELRGQELAAYLDEQDAAWFAAQGIDVDAELADYREDMLDREYHAGGHW